MASELLVDIGLGLYLGLLAGIFPAVVAFALGFAFRYLTGVSVPGLGVVVLAGALAGISGGLLGLLDEEVAQSAAGMAAFLVVLMLSLWAHSQGDKLGATVPRHLTLAGLRQTGLSTDILERVDTYGQIRIKPVGSIEDIEGYPQLPEETREAIRTNSWKYSAELTIAELESRLSENLRATYDLAEVAVSITADGFAEISAAPATAGLSRRVPSGKRAASIDTILPTGLAIGDQVELALPDGPVAGEVVSARTSGSKPDQESTEPPSTETDLEPDGGIETTAPTAIRAPTTDGGPGAITVAVPPEDARRVIQAAFAKTTVDSRGKSREYQILDILQRADNQFRLVTVTENGRFDGVTIGDVAVRDTFGVAILAIRRRSERIVAPVGSTRLDAGDDLLLTGKQDALEKFVGANQ